MLCKTVGRMHYEPTFTWDMSQKLNKKSEFIAIPGAEKNNIGSTYIHLISVYATRMFINVTNLYKYNVMLTNHLSQIFHVKSMKHPVYNVEVTGLWCTLLILYDK